MNKLRPLLYLGILSTISLFLTACQNHTAVVDEDAVKMEQLKSHPATSTTNKTKVKDPNAKVVTGHLDAGGLKWLTMEQASNLKNTDGKKFLVDVYTDWCGWCKIMDKRTFSDPTIKSYLEANYHLVKFNSEQHDPIKFKGKTYEWAPLGKNGINKLAFDLIGTSLSYPTLVFLDKDLMKIKHILGYKKPDQLMAELKLIDNS